MRKNILCFAAIALFMMIGAAQAITYNVNRTIGAGTVTGFVETDGTIGILATGNITDWVLTLSAPNLAGGSPDVIGFATQTETAVEAPRNNSDSDRYIL